MNAEKNKESKTTIKKEKDTKKAIKKVKENLEKTTLGDIDALANLKADMVKAEEKAKNPKSEQKEKTPDTETTT